MNGEQTKYEIGFLVSPLLPEDKVDAEMLNLRKIIEDSKGLVTDEERAKTRRLAYTIKAKGGTFDTAYFGWMKFLVDAGAIEQIKTMFEKNERVIRFLVMKIPKATASRSAFGMARKKKRVSVATPEEVIRAEEKKAVDVKEIDKKLEEILGK